MSAGRCLADWRDPSAYEWLDACGRHAFAWEWMRRRLDYQAAAAEPAAFAAVFGLRTWPAPDADARTARPTWTAAVDPFVLIAPARPCPRDERNSLLARVPACTTMHPGPDGAQWLFG